MRTSVSEETSEGDMRESEQGEEETRLVEDAESEREEEARDHVYDAADAFL